MRVRPSGAQLQISNALLACVRFDEDAARIRTAVALVDHGEFVRAAGFHGVAPLVQHRLAEAGLPVDPQLTSTYREQLFRHLIVMAELRDIGEVLSASGVSWLVFKGPVLAAAYERDDLRSYADVDLLVDRRRLAVALEALYEAGCTQVDRNWPMINAQTRGEMSLALRSGVALDLHWALVNEPTTRLALRVPVERMLARRVTRVIGEVSVQTLEPHDELAYVALHAFLSGGHRLVWLVDMDRLVRARSLDWDEVVRVARSCGLALPLAIMLDRARRYLGTDVPPSVTRGLASSLSWRGVIRVVDAVRSPVGSFAGGMSGRIFAQSYRGTTRATAVGLIHELHERRGRRHSTFGDPNPLHDDVPDTNARSDYLARVMSDAAV